MSGHKLPTKMGKFKKKLVIRNAFLSQGPGIFQRNTVEFQALVYTIYPTCVHLHGVRKECTCLVYRDS